MPEKEQYRPHIIRELNSYGVTCGPEGQNLQTWDYYELRAFLALEQLRRDTGVVQSVWF